MSSEIFFHIRNLIISLLLKNSLMTLCCRQNHILLNKLAPDHVYALHSHCLPFSLTLPILLKSDLNLLFFQILQACYSSQSLSTLCLLIAKPTLPLPSSIQVHKHLSRLTSVVFSGKPSLASLLLVSAPSLRKPWELHSQHCHHGVWHELCMGDNHVVP